MNSHPYQQSRSQESGFALIASLSIMAILVLIGVALFSLSSVATRSAELASARVEAQANAKTALMMAIGELQAELGPDQRISANASIRDISPEDASIDGVAHPHWLGVWDSWVAGDLANVRVNPDYPSGTGHHQTIGDPTDAALSDEMHPQYDQKNKHFRRWLVSLNLADADPENPDLPLNGLPQLDGDPIPGKDSTAVHLVGANSLGSNPDDTDFVIAQLLDINSRGTSTSGRYAWWVGDQSQKAIIKADSYDDAESNLTDADRLFRVQAPASMGTKLISDLSGITPEEEAQFAKVGSSLEQLDLIRVGGSEISGTPSTSFTLPEDLEQKHSFHHLTMDSYGVLADVREGGLKRDLSVLLERPIDVNENGDEFMLYAFDDPRFTDRSQSRVPIQDLAAYYQLYDDEPAFDNQRREGVRYDSSELSSAIQLNVPDYDGGSKDRQRVLQEYTTLYRQPVITKVQFLVGLTAQELTAADRQDIEDQISGTTRVQWNDPPSAPIRADDTHRLRVGMMPMVTLWNPNNVPLVMDSTQIFIMHNPPPVTLRWMKYRGGGADYESGWFTMSFLASGGVQLHGFSSGYSLMRLSLAGDGSEAVVFEPGEVKVFSVSPASGSKLNDGTDSMTLVGDQYEATPGYDPYGFFLMRQSAPYSSSQTPPDVFMFTTASGAGNPEANMVFNSSDSLSLFIDHDVGTGGWASGQIVAAKSEIKGAAFAFSMVDPGYIENWQDRLDFLKHYSMVSRHSHVNDNALKNEMAAFNEALMTPGFPGGVTPIEYDNPSESIQGSQLIGASNADPAEVIGMFEFSLSLGCEVSSASTGGFGGGRRITSRPFLHSPLSAPPFIDAADKASLYNYGWDWQLSKVNNIEDSIVQADPGTDNGFYGGGYTIESGTTHVVQREIPVVPPMSIASLSHAHLGGFSLARDALIGDDPNDTYGKNRVGQLQGTDYQKTTATGQGGLGPHVVQAIGNSYAHPNIPAENAFTTKDREFDTDEGEIDDIPFVDHSYLANKAIWDEYFFSSIAPQPSKVPLFGGANLTAKQVAEDFFSGVVDGLDDTDGDDAPTPLPNRRFIPYANNLDEAKFDVLFDESDSDGDGIPDMLKYADGLADKIAAHLMVEGNFNINSTSVEAWKVFLSSMKGKPIAYLDGGTAPAEVTTTGTALGAGILPNAEPINSSEITSPKFPPEQWKTGRELTDEEIDQLARALVKQIKLRGPFLSLSEFVNRRLFEYSEDEPYSLKGALQAALDDSTVSINANFRTGSRLLDDETADIDFSDGFPKAATGPIAYGSMAYVDQADVLRHFAGQLTPRGDTFVIRSYGDSLDASGSVIARVWCEAVVQRVPEYSDTTDLPHIKQADLTETNRSFGRKFKIISFRWLDSSEV